MTRARHEIGALIDRQRILLRDADYAGLTALLPQLETLLDDIRNGKVPIAALEPHRDGLRRNADLCRASAAGVGSVIRRLEELRRGHSGHRVYDSHGREVAVHGGNPGRDHRA